MDARKALLVDAYRRFNGRDVDGLLSMMTDDVEWPDVPNQAVLRSKDAIRQYWLGEFAVTDPQMVPTEFVPGAAEDEIVAVVEHEVRDLSGAVLVDRREMRHRYSFRDGLVRRMVVDYVDHADHADHADQLDRLDHAE